MGKLQSKAQAKTEVDEMFEHLLWETNQRGWKMITPLRKELGEVISSVEVFVTFEVPGGKQIEIRLNDKYGIQNTLDHLSQHTSN